jgi:7,8-dihydropterin-6-yl-methyl-4-(beta-D-ribofuranosyl)aminobenzene 5'-phosphate synthase
MKRLFLILLGGLGIVAVAVAGFQLIHHNKAVAQVEADWSSSAFQPFANPGTTTSLVILPLIDRNAGEGLRGEGGVSYLVRTDAATILFDLGANADGSAPLLHNMEVLDVSLDEIDAIVISHPHPDHRGGMAAMVGQTFSFGEEVSLGDMPIYTPVEMTYPGSTPTWAVEPTVIAPGVATTGTLAFLDPFPSPLLTAPNYEQSLLVNVEGRGVVAISGCGHPTIQRILGRADALFDDSVAGIVGGLHYPTSDGSDLGANIAYLATFSPQIVGLSPHDSSTAAIEAFRDAFPEAYRDIVVGEEIVFGV